MGKLNRVWTVNVWVSDRKRSIEFYTEKLGFDLALITEKHDWVELGLTGGFAKISLVEPRKDWGENYYKWATQMIGVKTGISFKTDDIQALYKDLSAKGVHFSGPPEEMPWGGFMATFVDPDGNEFMVVQDEEHYTREYE